MTMKIKDPEEYVVKYSTLVDLSIDHHFIFSIAFQIRI